MTENRLICEIRSSKKDGSVLDDLKQVIAEVQDELLDKIDLVDGNMKV